MDDELKGACIDVWRHEPLSSASKTLLTDYACYLNKVCVSFTIRFMEPKIEAEFEMPQIINAVGYRPVEEIVICGFFGPIFYAAEEILKKFGGYLKAGAPEDIIPTIKGQAHKIYYRDEDNPPTMLSHYHLLDGDFVANYFNVRRDPAVLKLFSLEEFTISRDKVNDLLSRESRN
jgi:hypothetical protein